MIKKYSILAFVILGAIFFFFPKLDIAFTQLFYHERLDFIYRDHPLVVASFRLVPIITITWAALCLSAIVYAFWKKKKILSSPATYLLITALLGPGLFVNTALKENVGRARPRQILEFGGDKAFTAPLIITDQCENNCSFSSGHAAMAYYFSAISYVTPPPYSGVAFLVGLSAGSVVGFGRVLQGGHFLSDVIFSGLFVMIINELCFILWIKLKANQKSVKTKHGVHYARGRRRSSKKG